MLNGVECGHAAGTQKKQNPRTLGEKEKPYKPRPKEVFFRVILKPTQKLSESGTSRKVICKHLYKIRFQRELFPPLWFPPGFDEILGRLLRRRVEEKRAVESAVYGAEPNIALLRKVL